MSRVRKSTIFGLILLLMLLLCAAVGACAKQPFSVLSAPQNVYIDEDEFLRWDKVEGAERYFVIFNDEEYTTTENCFDLFDKTTSYETPYRMSVMALGDMKKTADSEFSVEIEYTLPKQSIYGYQKDDGYGYAVFADPNAKPTGKLIIPSNAVEILEDGFKDCTEITGLWISDSVSSMKSGPILGGAFRGCTNLRRVRLPQGEFRSIGTGTFSDCSSLWDVKIPDNVTRISGGFAGCSSLKEITIPASVTNLGMNSFAGCPLERIEVEEGNPVYYSEGNCVIRREDNRLEFGCGTSVIPDTVKTIAMSAFSGCPNLASLVLPEGLETIQSYAFSDCPLESIAIPKSVTSCDSAFDGCNNLKSITVAEGNPVYYSENDCLIERATKKLIDACNHSVIPNDVEIIGAHAFGSRNLTEIVIPESVKTIEQSTFSHCYLLRSIRLPEGLETIGNGAFASCDSLQAVTIPNSVTKIEYSAFANSSNTTFYIPYLRDEKPDGWEVKFSSGSLFWGCTFGYDGAYPYVISTAELESYVTESKFYATYQLLGRNYVGAPERAGYTFAGWATKEGGEVVYSAYTAQPPSSASSSATFGEYKIEHLVTFDCSSNNIAALIKELTGKTLYAVWIPNE